MAPRAPLLLALAVAALAWVTAEEAGAAHFRGGTLDWHKPVPRADQELAPPGVVNITGHLMFRCSAWVPDGCPGEGVLLLGSADWVLYLGDGASAPFDLQVVDTDPERDLLVGRIIARGTPGGPVRQIQHTFDTSQASGGPYLVHWDGCCRPGADGAVTNIGAPPRLTMSVDLMQRASPGVDNVPIRYCAPEAQCKFQVLAVSRPHVEEGRLSFRMARPCEAHEYCRFETPAYRHDPAGPDPRHDIAAPELDARNGTVVWDTRNAVQDLARGYPMQIVVEDGAASVVEDFMVFVVPEDVCPSTHRVEVVPATGRASCIARQCEDDEQAGCRQDPLRDPRRPPPAARAPDRNESVAGLDQDADRIRDRDDLCPFQPYRPDPRDRPQPDSDGDGRGDGCDDDMDGDGIPDEEDDDTDGDGVADEEDLCPRDPTDACQAARDAAEEAAQEVEEAEEAAGNLPVHDVGAEEDETATVPAAKADAQRAGRIGWGIAISVAAVLLVLGLVLGRR